MKIQKHTQRNTNKTPHQDLPHISKRAITRQSRRARGLNKKTNQNIIIIKLPNLGMRPGCDQHPGTFIAKYRAKAYTSYMFTNRN